jgi:hypothetical protein
MSKVPSILGNEEKIVVRRFDFRENNDMAL